MRLPGLLGAVTVACEDLLVGNAAAGRLGRGEDAFQVDRAMGGRLGRVINDDLPEVALGKQRSCGHPPDVEKVPEVAELVDPGQFLDRVGGQRDAIAAGEPEQRGRPDRALEMDMQLDLGVAHPAHPPIRDRHAPITLRLPFRES